MTAPFHGRDQEILEGIEDATLAPYATRSVGASRRYVLRDHGRTLAYRTAFQRDRDRILHSQAFRRLKHKTQVYVPYDGDHHRTRLTHTLEVAQVARTIARALGLNEDLTEAIALGHDLGQPPFGRGGLEALEEILFATDPVEGVDEGAVHGCGGFRPNWQGVRIVDRLEYRYDHPGLNLSDPVREGIWKCGPCDGADAPADRAIAYPQWEEEGLHSGEPPHLEAQVVGIADLLAGLAHDLEDGLRDGGASIDAAERLDIAAAVVSKLGDAYPQVRSPSPRRNALIRGIFHLLVSDAVVASLERLSGAEGARYPSGTVAFSERGAELAAELGEFVEAHVYRSHAVRRLDARGRTVVRGLFAAYYRDPLQLDDYVLIRYRELGGGPYLRDVAAAHARAEVRERYHGRPEFIRVISDHISGMSDTFALNEYRRLLLPFPDADAT